MKYLIIIKNKLHKENVMAKDDKEHREKIEKMEGNIQLMVTSMQELTIGVSKAVNSMESSVSRMEDKLDKEKSKVPEIYKHFGTLMLAILPLGGTYMKMNNDLIIAQQNISVLTRDIKDMNIKFAKIETLIKHDDLAVKTKEDMIKESIANVRADLEYQTRISSTSRKNMARDIKQLKGKK